VILLGPLPTGEFIRESFDAGVDVIVDPDGGVQVDGIGRTRMNPALAPT
jgi:hypothetical protein